VRNITIIQGVCRCLSERLFIEKKQKKGAFFGRVKKIFSGGIFYIIGVKQGELLYMSKEI